MDSDRQWFKSKIGLTAEQTSRHIAFCAHAILENKPLLVADALADERFKNNPLVTGEPHIRFYCGVPLVTPEGFRIGTLSVIDHVPRTLTAKQQETLQVLSRQVIEHLRLNRSLRELARAHSRLEQMHDTLRRSEEKSRTLNESSPSAIFIYRGDRILYANQAAALISGYPVEELLTMDMWKMGHPDFLPVLKARAQAAQKGEAAPARYEFKIIRKDGQERWLDFTAATIDYEGQPARLATGYDITERKQAEEALTERERMLQLIFDSEPECVKLLDASGALLNMNRSGLAMLEADSFGQVANRCIYPLVTAEHRAQFLALAERVFRGESGTLEFEIVGLKGTRRWLETHASSLRDRTGKIIALLSITRDITERKRAEIELHAAYGRLKDLTTRLTQAEEAERRRIARELHDELGQIMTAMRYDLSWLQKQFETARREEARKRRRGSATC